MKFKKILSLSVALTATLVLSSNILFRDAPADSSGKRKKVERLCPDLKIKTDTVHFTDLNIDSLYPRTAGGQFNPNTNTVHMTYFAYDPDASIHVKTICDRANGSARIIKRHEMEHAEKAHIIQNVNNLSPYDRARLAVMNEVMAPASEIIESQEYRFETGGRFPYNRRFLWKADDLIMARHKEMYPETSRCMPVDFTNPVIADIVLESALDNFERAHKSGFYKTKIKRELKGKKNPKYKPHNQCKYDFVEYAPERDQWGALWTYDVSTPWHGKQRVDIWNSATAATRARIINKVDSIVRSDMTPEQKLNPNTYKKSR